MPKDLFVDSNGIRLAVRDYGGSGIPIVLVHGHLGNLGSFDDLGPLLAQHMRVVAYDQRGHGWSESGPVTVSDFASDLKAVIAALSLERPVLYGSSFGTLVCLGYIVDGGDARAFITEDGRVDNFPDVPAEVAPPQAPRRILSEPDWRAVVAGFAGFGTAGEATALRSCTRRPDGTFEIRPSSEDIFAKERAFMSVRVIDAYRAAPAPVLVLAAKNGIDARTDRESQIADLTAGVGAQVSWFETGHWISAADPKGVADEVTRFVLRPQ